MEHGMSLMVTDFGLVTSIRFRDGTYDESDGSEMEPSS